MSINITNKKVCYTCVVSPKDELKEIVRKSAGWDYVCISLSKEVTSETWDIRYIDESNNDNYNNLSIYKKKSFFKTLPNFIFQDYDESIYIEPYIAIQDNLNAISSLYCNELMSVILHPIKNCAYQEFIECISRSIDEHKILERQLKKYVKEGFPLNFGLYDTSFIYRRHNEEDCLMIMNEWFNEISLNSYLDHLSLPYALWKSASRDSISIIPRNVFLSI